MKYGLFSIAVLAFLQTAVSHNNYPAAATTEVVVWVDQLGHTLSVETRPASSSHATPSSSSTSSAVSHAAQSSKHRPSSTSSALIPTVPTSTTAPQREQPAGPAESAQLLQEATGVIPNAAVPDIGQLIPPIFASAAEKSKTKRGKYGTSYSPYRADSTCKGQSEVDRDIHALREFGLVRIYGVDCDQARTVSHAVRQHSHMRVFAGIYDLSHIDGDLQTLIAAAAGDWAIFHTVSIGNELVNKGENTPAEVIGAVNGARQSLRAAGYDGPVVTVDTFNKLIEHPDLCAASDYCAANCHAFFDATQTAETAGPYVAEQARLVSQAVGGGKSTMITESGWPYAGVPNGKAIPSKENQELAIRSLEDSFPDGGLILFSAFDDRWKQDNAWTFATEKFWGFLHR